MLFAQAVAATPVTSRQMPKRSVRRSVQLYLAVRDKGLVEMPLAPRARAAATQRIDVLLAERAAPLAHRLVGHDHAPPCQQRLDIAVGGALTWSRGAKDST